MSNIETFNDIDMNRVFSNKVKKAEPKTSFNKFVKEEWNRVEKAYESEMVCTVLDVLSDLGENKYDTKYLKKNFEVCGDEVYVQLRDKLVEIKLLKKKKIVLKSAKKGGKKQKIKRRGITKEEIIRQNTIKKAVHSLEETLKMLQSSSRRLRSEYGFRTHYAEIRLVTFMYCCFFCIKRKQPLEYAYELTIGIAKTLNNIDRIEGVSQVAVEDLRVCHSMLIKYCKFSYETLFNKFPKFCLSTRYDFVFPTMAIKPYPSQMELMDKIRKSKKFLCFLNAMIGSGKTSLVVALSRYIQSIRMVGKASSKNKEDSSIQLIFACSVEPVRREVCRMAYNQHIPFGISVVEGETVRVINNYNCKKDPDRILIVADLESTFKLLAQSRNYILFLDEPTVGADTDGDPITHAVMKVMLIPPERTILSSATLPSPNEISGIVDHFKSLHPGADTISVCSKETMIGCEIINFDGSTVVPYVGCETRDELEYIIKQLEEKTFIDRLLPAPIVYKLRKNMVDSGIKDVISLEDYFSDVSSLTQNNIQKAAIQLLKQLQSVGTDDQITQVCKYLGQLVLEKDGDKLSGNSSSGSSSSDDDCGFSFTDDADDDDSDQETFNLDEIFTKQAYRFAGPCLIAVKDPMKFVEEKGKPILEQTEPSSKLIAKYKANNEKYKVLMSRFDAIKNEDDRTQKQQEMKDMSSPSIPFPKHLRVNTAYHLAKYNPKVYKEKSVSRCFLQHLHPLEDIPMDLNVPDWVITMLYAGVGIYVPSNMYISSEYTDTVLNMAADGKLAFLVADESICYGANYPFSHVVIGDDIAEHHSINTIFQLLGRAGRVGESWVAYGHVGNVTTKRILNYIHGKEQSGISIEAQNMNKTFSSHLQLVEERRKEIKEAEEKEKAEKTEKAKKETIKITTLNKVKMSDIRSVKPKRVEQKDSRRGRHNTQNRRNTQNRSEPKTNRYVPPHLRNKSGENTQNDDEGWKKVSNRRNNRWRK